MNFAQRIHPTVQSDVNGIRWKFTPKIVPRKPVRVLRVVEPGQARSSVGRMLISGRMSDVCAELDRLAAREEATLQ